MKITHRQLRRMIAEEVSAHGRRGSSLDEGFLDDVVGKVKGFFGKQSPQAATMKKSDRKPAYVERFVALTDHFQKQAVDLLRAYGEAGQDLLKIGKLAGRLNAIQQTAMDIASVAANVAGKRPNEMYFSVAKHLMSREDGKKPSNEEVLQMTNDVKHKADVFSRNMGNLIKDISNINSIIKLGKSVTDADLKMLERLFNKAFAFVQSKEQSLWIDDYVKFLQQMPEDLMKENKQTISITRLRQIIKEELARVMVETKNAGTATPAAQGMQQGPIDLASSPDAAITRIAQLLGNEKLKTSLIAAVKKAEAGRPPSELGPDKKLALADSFLDLIFADPQKTALVAAQLKNIKPKPKP
jgi:hypothetical protein